MIVLGIESSCDETALALLDCDKPAGKRVLAHSLFSQVELHAENGGVVPEVAARAHIERISQLSKNCFDTAKLKPHHVDLVAGIAGPGLIGGVSVGMMFAKGFALAKNIPMQPVNHLAGHALTARMTDDVSYPFLLLLVSGGHCQILVVESPITFRRWATTIDDAVGEAFDKSAKIMGLSFPGGPALENAAMGGDPKRFSLPRPMVKKPTMDFSFSGLKTATAKALKECVTDADIKDLAASFQAAACDSLIEQTRKAVNKFADQYAPHQSLVIAGGVARNKLVRSRLEKLGNEVGMNVVMPPMEYCTDNAAMIAWAGYEQYNETKNQGANAIDYLSFAPRPRWPLDPEAEPSIFAGAAKA